MRTRSLLTIMIAALACSAAVADTFSVTIKVVDADNKPVAKAGAGTLWTYEDEGKLRTKPNAIVTDKDGKALAVIDNWEETRPLLVMSADRKLGAIIGVSKEDDGKEVIVTVGPTVRVKGKLECKELN